MKAAYIEQTGPPEVLVFGERPMPSPAAGEVLVKIAAAGVNFADVNVRSGVNKVPLRAIPGMEAAGVIEKIGEGVTGFAPGEPRGLRDGSRLVRRIRRCSAKMLARIPEGTSWKPRLPPCCRVFTAHYRQRKPPIRSRRE